MAASDPPLELVPWRPEELAHVGVVVPKMEKAMTQWQRAGAALVIPPHFDPIQNVTCALLILAGSVPIELVAPAPEGPNPVANRLAKGGGIDHVCVYTDDVAASVAAQVAAGAVCVVEPVYGAVFDRTIAFVVTRPGFVVEFMQKQAVGRAEKDPLRSLAGGPGAAHRTGA